MSQLKVKLNRTGNRCIVVLDGEELHGVRSIKVECAAGEATRVWLELIAPEVEIDADVDDEQIIATLLKRRVQA